MPSVNILSYRAKWKRFVDIVGASVALLVLFPLLIAGACIVWTFLGRPVMFSQMRPGLHGVPFKLRKLRTMRGDNWIHPAHDQERLMTAGRVLRALSIDELPELWNVLRGDMSLVGPRPLLQQYLNRYSASQARRHEVKPGITGWAQVNGRNAIDWEKKFELDVWYVDHLSFCVDMKILTITIWQVLSRRGITAPGEATAPEFMGSRPCA